MIVAPGKQATRSQQLLLTPLVVKREPNEVIVIHHVTQDTPYRLQVEVERQSKTLGVAFERIVL